MNIMIIYLVAVVASWNRGIATSSMCHRLNYSKLLWA